MTPNGLVFSFNIRHALSLIYDRLWQAEAVLLIFLTSPESMYRYMLAFPHES